VGYFTACRKCFNVASYRQADIDSEYPRHGTVFQKASLVAIHFRLRSVYLVLNTAISVFLHMYVTTYIVRQTLKLKFEIKHSVANFSNVWTFVCRTASPDRDTII
jgi:hypothetical protein